MFEIFLTEAQISEAFETVYEYTPSQNESSEEELDFE